MQNRVLSLAVGHDDGMIKSYFGIEHEGKLWLVTAWLIDRSTGAATPERMIRVDALERPPQKCQPEEKFDFVIQLLPKAVIEGGSQDIPGFEVRSLPDSPQVHRSALFQLPSVHG
jgi:hypothetical protein